MNFLNVYVARNIYFFFLSYSYRSICFSFHPYIYPFSFQSTDISHPLIASQNACISSENASEHTQKREKIINPPPKIIFS